MKTKFNGILTLLLAFVVQLSFAQEKTISGTVLDETSMPLPGATVVIKGTTTGTSTDFDGNYSISANSGDVLTFSYVGYANQDATVGASDKIDISLAPDNTLTEVVVTALGIKKEKKALGYAVTTLGSEELEQKPQADVARALNGKIAGVQITGAGGASGSATNVIIRSKNSINGNNQALYVIDGVPFSGGGEPVSEGFTVGNTSSSRALDIDPNNIADISVLKGLSAAVLYGAAGRNGVILITTKNAASKSDVAKKTEISLTQTNYMTKISNLPDFQNKYGQGADQLFNPGYVGNWGAAFDSSVMVAHPYAQGPGAAAFPEYAGTTRPYVAAKNNVEDFFRTGFGSSTSVGVSSATETTSINASLGRTKEEGYIPENGLNRLTLGVGGRAKLTNKFTATSAMNFAKTTVKSPPISAGNGGGASIFERLLFIPRNLDLGNLPYQDPTTGASVYYRTDQENPYWLLHNAGNKNVTNRFFGNLGLSYEVNDNINISYKFGLDTYTSNSRNHVNRGGVANEQYLAGYMRSTTSTNQIMDHNIFATFEYDLSDKIGFGLTTGFNARRDDYTRNGISSTGQIVFGRLNHDNFTDHTGSDPLIGDLQYQQTVGLYGAYAQADFDYNNYLYVTLAGRNDWTSTTEKNNNSLFYPSVSMSFIPTSAFGSLKGDAVNYLKVRAGYATSAGFADPYRTRARLLLNAATHIDNQGNVVVTNDPSTVFANPDLKPELHKEFEAGIEGKFWKNRVNLDLSVYNRISTDQIVNSNTAPTSGFTVSTINLGEIETNGIEAGLNISPFKKDAAFQWNINTNFTAYETIVNETQNGAEINYAGFSNLGNFAVEGEPLGVIKGSYMVRDDAGNIVINPNNGKIFSSDDLNLEDEIIGDPNPDWKLNTANTFSYKNFSLGAQVEYTHGGDIYSTTTANLLRRGVTTDTDDREGTFIIPGVLGDPATGEPLLDANGQKIPNTIQIGANDLYFINLMDPSGNAVYDASHIRLREVSFGYTFDKKLISKTPFGNLSITLSGQNLWVKAFNMPAGVNFDPEVLSTGVGNGAGLDFQTAPSAKRFAVSVKATF